jgi:hypothetical protein
MKRGARKPLRELCRQVRRLQMVETRDRLRLALEVHAHLGVVREVLRKPLLAVYDVFLDYPALGVGPDSTHRPAR